MNIGIDVMSGDKAPLEIIKGAFAALQMFPMINVTLIGNEKIIKTICSSLLYKLDDNRIQIVHTESVITMDDKPLCVVREKSDSSMAVGLRLLSEGITDAFVSAGNTGALHAGSTLIVRRIKGIARSAIATILPFDEPLMLIDSGANTEVTKENLGQFAIMGSIYTEKIFGLQRPRVGLANNGTEPGKGTRSLVEAYQYLSELPHINFIGNVEGSQIPFSVCDVLVCDGLIGNIILKHTESMAKFFLLKLRELFMRNAVTKLSAAVMKPAFSGFKKTFNASEYGGAPMLGISKPVIKAHGSSDAEAVKNAVRQAIEYINTGIIVDIVKAIVPEKGTDPK